VKPNEKALPGFEPLFSEIISKIPRRRKRGRPRKYDNPTHRRYLKNRSAMILGFLVQKKMQNGEKLSVRQQQNHIHAERAWNILSKDKTVLNSMVGAAIIQHFHNRHTLLAELGRIESKDWLIRTAELIASNGLKGEAARSEIRKIRFGKCSLRSWRNYSILNAKIWKAVCQYRNLYPDITDEKIFSDLEQVIGWTRESLKLAASVRKRKKSASIPVL
jgi:hypothetical protein